MRHLLRPLLLCTCLGLLVAPAVARASTGVCDQSSGNTGTTEEACVAAIQALGPGTVVDGIFKDAQGRTGDKLPIYGKLINPFPGCTTGNSICNGDLTNYQANPKVNCVNRDRSFATIASFVDALDWKYANSIRLHDNHGMNGPCPVWTDQVTDGNKEGYKPWEGLVFDLGGPSNKVVLFPVNDHGPQPCESIEYTVYLTNNPASRQIIDDPTTTGADPNKWNRAKLSKLFLEGWKKVRSGTDPGLNYTIEADSFASVWSLPCGINFRYVGVIAGNDGKDIPACNYDSFDAELDAVAGLTQNGTAVCPDADHDGYVDCNCPAAPKVCDCNDHDPNVHPGAPETCADPDMNCDGVAGSCPAGQFCYQKSCVLPCEGGEIISCPKGTTCQATSQGPFCIATDCSAGAACPPGSACDTASGTCKPACDGVTCPQGQKCEGGQCIDPCAQVVCPSGQSCVAGQCQPPCSCFAGDVGCPTGQVCDKGGSKTCVAPACKGVVCAAGQRCNAQGQCVGVCAGVTCPQGQRCDPQAGACVSLCTGVSCSGGLTCDPGTGKCVDPSCVGVTCTAPNTCQQGICEPPPTDGGVGDGGASDGGPGGHGGADGGGLTDGGGDGGDGTGTAATGCGCSTRGGSAGLGAFLLLGGLLALGRRRR